MTMQKRQPYPLQWPEGWKREKFRTRPIFHANHFAQIRDSVIRQLRKRGSNVVITSDLPLRNDGLPYANGRCEDPGVAVWWVEKGKEQVLACDRWNHINYNLSAIDRTLEALRGIDRWGTSSIVDKAFAGFAALPPPGHTSNGTDTVAPIAMPDWREVFGISDALTTLPSRELLAVVKLRYREQMQSAHPDRGGHAELATVLNHAMAETERELGPLG